MSGVIITLFVIYSFLAYSAIGGMVTLIVDEFYPLIDDKESILLCTVFWPLVFIIGMVYIFFVVLPSWIIEHFEDWVKSQKGGEK